MHTTTIASRVTSPAAIRRMEVQMEKQEDNKQKVLLLDRLAWHYSFTNVKKAQEILRIQGKIFKENSYPDFILNYYINVAFVENQLYNFDLAQMHYEKVLDLVDDIGAAKQQATVYIDYSGVCINRGDLEEASHYLDRAEKTIDAFPDLKIKARIITRRGYLSLHYAHYAKAIESFLEAQKILNAVKQPLDLKDNYFLALIWSGLGDVYERNEDVKKSVNCYLNAVKICEELGMKTRLSWYYLKVGSGYMSQGEYESAEIYLRKSLRRTRDDISRYSRASAYANLGYIYFISKEDHKNAFRMWNSAEKHFKDRYAHDYGNFSTIEHWRGQVYTKVEKWKKAAKHYKRALTFAKRSGDSKQVAAVCLDFAKLYAKQENYKDAYKYQCDYDKMSKEAAKHTNQRMMLELIVKYEAEKKKQEAELLRLEAAGLQLKALRAQMNPHFMYNALNSIQNYITSHKAETAAKYLAKFAKLMRQSLDYSDMETISLEEEVSFLEDYLYINNKLRFDDCLSYEINIDEEIEEDIIGVPAMIIQPYVENAIEHGLRFAKSGKVTLDFKPVDDFTILCVVQDNGVGREKAKVLKQQDEKFINHESKGTIITEKRLDILNKSRGNTLFVKTVDLYDKEGGACGTRVEIQIPIEIIQKNVLPELS